MLGCRIAGGLNAAGWRPPKRAAFDAGVTQRPMFRHGTTGARPIWSRAVPRKPGAEWTPHEAAERLGMHRQTAHHGCAGGRLRGRLATRGGQHIWLVTMSGGELDQIQAALPKSTRTRNPC